MIAKRMTFIISEALLQSEEKLIFTDTQVLLKYVSNQLFLSFLLSSFYGGGEGGGRGTTRIRESGYTQQWRITRANF